MYDKHLDSFIAVAEAGSFNAAAEKLFISRTALIQHINLLEEHLGFPLFERSSKGVSLTAAGHIVLDEATKIIRISNRTLQKCRALQENDIIRIGMLPNFTPRLIPDICRAFSKQYPNVHIKFEEYSLDSYFTAFAAGEFDITTEYICGYIFDHPEYTFVKLQEDKHCCGVGTEHPFAGKGHISIEDLKGQKIMMYAKGITRADNKLRNYLMAHIPDIEIIDTYYDSSCAMRCELAGAILIYYSQYWESFPTLVRVSLDKCFEFPIDIGLGYRINANPMIERFVAVAQEIYAGEHWNAL